MHLTHLFKKTKKKSYQKNYFISFSSVFIETKQLPSWVKQKYKQEWSCSYLMRLQYIRSESERRSKTVWTHTLILTQPGIGSRVPESLVDLHLFFGERNVAGHCFQAILLLLLRPQRRKCGTVCLLMLCELNQVFVIILEEGRTLTVEWFKKRKCIMFKKR